ncbi:MAG: phage tail sheath family protein [bacterium]|nr:phage tail sheath family protein [bacterium]
MALGGGVFVTQNKKLPGAYINFVSAASANAALSDRGIATMPLELDWGPDGEVFEVTAEDFRRNSKEIFGYEYGNEKLKGLRDLFLNARTLYAYRLNGGGEKASNIYAEALYSGERGNDLKIIIQKNVDNDTLFDVTTVVDTTEVDTQTVLEASELMSNQYVTFKEDAVLAPTASTPLEGGKSKEVDGAAYQNYLDKIEGYTYNTMGVVVEDDTTKSLLVSFVKRMRDEMGIKFQLVLYNKAADYYGVINVKNSVVDVGWSEASLIYWVTGISAGCEVSKSNQNKIYNGEFTVNADYTQNELISAIDAGEFVLHKVGADIRVLSDINSMVTISETQGDIFKENQTVRVLDQIANDIAVLFNTKFLGEIPNNVAGRISLWSDIVKHHEQLQEIGAIENFSDGDVTVEEGSTKKSVVVNDAITVVNAMSKLYMTVAVA